MTPRKLLVVFVAAGIVAGSLPGAALAGAAAPGSAPASIQADDSGNGTSASTGQQLATVIEVTDDEVNGDLESSAFEAAMETDNETVRAEAMADRAATLRERADAISEEQRSATEAYEAGELSDAEYAQRLAVLNARATTVLDAFADLDDRASDVSTFELEAAGYDRPANDAAREQLRSVTGSGASALFEQYTGESEGEFSVETENGVSIDVESEDGDRSREFEREQPGNGSLVVTQGDALQTARDALNTPDETGTWTLRKASVDEEDGAYEFEFAYRSANATGEAEVDVDGETGEIFAFEEEIEVRDTDDDADEADDDDDHEDEEDDADDDADRPLSIGIVEGTAAPGATVTLQVTQAGAPVEGATVEVGDGAGGETDADGQVTVTLPDGEEAEIEAEKGEAEGELEFEFGEQETDPEDEIREDLSVSGTADNGTVSVSVSYDGSAVEGVTVLANGERVGTTGADGTLTFETNATEELEVVLRKGSITAELTFEIRDGALEQTDSEIDVENESDDAEDEREDEDEDEDEEREDESEHEDDEEHEDEAEEEREDEDEGDEDDEEDDEGEDDDDEEDGDDADEADEEDASDQDEDDN